jgi:hypothetical protein
MEARHLLLNKPDSLYALVEMDEIINVGLFHEIMLP